MHFNKNKLAAIFAGGVVAALLASAPALADDDVLFGQPAPKQYLLNKMFSPKSLGLNDPSSGGASGQVAGAAKGQAASGAPQNDDDDDNGPLPKRYLLNRLFDLGK